MLIANSRNNNLREFSVDSMVIDEILVVWLKVVDWEFSEESHYPILAGYDEHGTPLYVCSGQTRIHFLFYMRREWGAESKIQ